MSEEKNTSKWLVGWKTFLSLSIAAVVLGAIMVTLGWQSGQRKVIQPPFTTIPSNVTVAGTSMGSPSAPITIMEYSDFQCRFCQNFAISIEPQIEATYIQTGKVRLVFKYVVAFGSESQLAAEAAECAADQNQFWPFYNNLMRLQFSPDDEDITVEKLQEVARQIGLDMAVFDESLSSGKFRDKVIQSDAEGRALAINGIPAFIVNGTLADEKVADSFGEFQKVLDAELARLGQ
jgi:protein-disulfide isomerase